MAYFYTKLSGIIICACIIIYFYYRYNYPKRMVSFETKLNNAYNLHKILLFALLAGVVITYVIYKIEHRLLVHSSLIKEYKMMRGYLDTLSKRKEPPSPKDGVLFKKLKQLQYFTDNESLRRSIKNRDYDITAQILQEKMEETYPSMIRQILCNNAESCVMAISGNPIIGLAKLMKK